LVPDAVNPATVQRALVVKLRHHGDVLLSSPVFTVLKNRAPHARIDALVYADTRDMLAGHPAIDRVHVIDRAWKRQGLAVQAQREGELLNTLRAGRYNLLVHLTEHWRGAWLRRLLGIRYAVAPQRPGASPSWARSFTHLYALPRGTVRARLLKIESKRDSQAIGILIQNAGWIGGRHGWPEHIRWICESVSWRP